MRVKDTRGFTLIELLTTVALVAILAAIGLPGLLRARAAGNESSAIASLRAVHSAQVAFASSCASGAYAATLPVLGTPPFNDSGFLSPDITSDPNPIKSGFQLGMDGTAAPATHPAACNGGGMVTGYYVWASPTAPGMSGRRYFWMSTSGSVYQQDAAFASTNEYGGPDSDAAAVPIQ